MFVRCGNVIWFIENRVIRMKFYKTKNLITILFVCLSIISWSQGTNSDLPTRASKKERAAFIGITAGLSQSSFRDFATSPLIYDGSALYLALSGIKTNVRNEFEMGISTSVGSYRTEFNGHITTSDMYTGSFFYSQLYQIPFPNSPKWNIKAGGLVDVTGNLRQNESFGNNGLGFEFFPTLFGSVKVTRDISRTNAEQRKILFISYRLQPISRNISFRLNPGIINSTYRNAYIYFRHTSALDKTKPFVDYEYKFLSGFRMSTAFDYTVRLKNKNRYQLSYLWNVYRTGGELDKYEMAQHTIKVTLFYNTNNK